MSERPSITDSGERRTFDSGAVRDRGTLKPRPDLISPHANTAEGWVLAEGAVKYAARNWEKGIPISECMASTMRHLEAFKLGQQDEPHLAQARTNIGFILHYLGEIKAGRMDPAIDDMPHYEDRLPGVDATRLAQWDQYVVEETGRVKQMVGGSEIEKLPAIVTPEKKKGMTHEGWKKLNDVMMETFYDMFPTPEDFFGPPPDPRVLKMFEPSPLRKRQLARPTVYIAGPMRGIPQSNFPAFDAARDQWAQCYNVISPADLDRAAGDNSGEDTDDATYSVAHLAKIIGRDLDVILAFDPANGDGIAVLPGWKASRGARVEVALAVFLGLKVWDAETGIEVEVG